MKRGSLPVLLPLALLAVLIAAIAGCSKQSSMLTAPDNSANTPSVSSLKLGAPELRAAFRVQEALGGPQSQYPESTASAFSPPYRLYIHTFDQNGEIDGSFYSGDVMKVRVQVQENDVSVSGKEVYLWHMNYQSGNLVVIGNIGATDSEGFTYKWLIVDQWFSFPDCDAYQLIAQVYENGQFVPERDWASVYVFPSGCSSPSPDPNLGGGLEVFDDPGFYLPHFKRRPY